MSQKLDHLKIEDELLNVIPTLRFLSDALLVTDTASNHGAIGLAYILDTMAENLSACYVAETDGGAA